MILAEDELAIGTEHAGILVLEDDPPARGVSVDRVARQTLIVRRANPREKDETLAGQTRTLDDQMVLIADAGGPTSIAGVMSGARAEVGEDTTRVRMEVAT